VTDENIFFVAAEPVQLGQDAQNGFNAARAAARRNLCVDCNT